jgi:hypothetical protein
MLITKETIQQLVLRGQAGILRPADGPILMEALTLAAKGKIATYIKMAMERVGKIDPDVVHEAEGEKLMHDIEQLHRNRASKDHLDGHLDVLLGNDSLGG